MNDRPRQSEAEAERPKLSGTVRGERLHDVVTHSAEQTVAFGRSLAADLRPSCPVLLEGELGSGKTTLAKGIVAGLGAASEAEVSSPSFTLVHQYGTEGRVYHADLYRLESARDLATLGLDELVGSGATVLIEWADRLGGDLPAPCVRIRLEHLGGDQRRILVERIERPEPGKAEP